MELWQGDGLMSGNFGGQKIKIPEKKHTFFFSRILDRNHSYLAILNHLNLLWPAKEKNQQFRVARAEEKAFGKAEEQSVVRTRLYHDISWRIGSEF